MLEDWKETHSIWERQPKGRLHHIQGTANDDYRLQCRGKAANKTEPNTKSSWGMTSQWDGTFEIQENPHCLLPILPKELVTVLHEVPKSGIQE